MSTSTSDYKKPSVAPSGMDHDALPPGTRFGEFEILKVLGVGGFGIVYLANDHSLEREVALKEYMPASLAARGAGPQITVRSSSFAETYAIGLRSFVNEARLLARFDHPSLVKVYRFWEDNATAYMVMPFLQGTTLRDTRRAMAHPPDEAWIRSVMAPILSALELLHREGVYHRDIAPDNILLPHDGPPVLLDFGAARRVISDRTQSLTAILKPSYAPIEQYAEMTQLRQGPWTDLYALGAVVHYLLFGAPPAPATARAVQDDVDAIENRAVPGVSPAFLEAVAWMLSIRPNQRPQSGEQLRAVLEGHAVIPPRGRPGITIPGGVAPAVAAAFEISQPAPFSPGPASIDTADVPTYLPTARVAAPSAPRPTSFNPATQMPTARLPPAEPATTAPSMRRTSAAGPSTVAPAPATVPPPATRAPQAAARRPDAQASRPATLPPPVTTTQRPAASQPRSTRPAALAGPASAADAPPAKSKAGLAIAAAAALIVVALAAGWQLMGKRGDAGAADGASAAASAASASVAGTAAAEPAAAVPVPVPVPPPATATASPFDALTPAASATTAPALAGSANVAASALPYRPAASGLPVPAALPDAGRLGAAAAGRTAASGAMPFDARASSAADRAALAAAASAASNARGRLAGKPVPRTDGDPATTYNGPPGRGPDAGSNANNPPYGSPGMTAADRARAAAAANSRDAAQAQRPQPAPVPAVAEAQPTSAREACGKRVFISLAICMDEKCEEARFRNTPECVGILARKTARENR